MLDSAGIDTLRKISILERRQELLAEAVEFCLHMTIDWHTFRKERERSKLHRLICHEFGLPKERTG